jgi:hypothetical protein
MMVDYAAIADAAAAYADYQAAFDAMSALTEPAPNASITGNGLRAWAAQHDADYQILKGGTDALSEVALRMIDTPDSLLDMADPQIQGFVTALGISQAGKDALFSRATRTQKVWPGLRPGHVQNAVQMRAEGRV